MAIEFLRPNVAYGTHNRFETTKEPHPWVVSADPKERFWMARDLARACAVCGKWPVGVGATKNKARRALKALGPCRHGRDDGQ